MHPPRHLPRPRPRGVTRVALLASAALLAVALSGCTVHVPLSALDGRIAVVAGENTWGDVAAQIGGSLTSVTSLITDPNADPHTYETSPRDAAEVTRARLVIVNGVGYDDFLSKLIGAGHSSGRTVLNLQQQLHVTGADPNPHLWYSATYVTEAASDIATALTRADPAGGPTFAANLATFLAGYAPYSAVITQIKARHAGTSIAYTERVAGYLVTSAGLALGVPVPFTLAIENGDDPSPQDTYLTERAITTGAVKVLLYNAQVVTPETAVVRALAVRHHVPVVGVTETVPANASDFAAWQITQAREILTALGG